MYQFFTDMIGTLPVDPNGVILAGCVAVGVISVCVCIRVLFLVLDYMIGGRKR